MSKTLLYITHDISSATSYYRGYGELAKIQKLYADEFKIEIAKGLDWHDLLKADAVFMERPYSPTYRDFLLYAQQEGTPVWVDYDDYLLGIPTCNPTYKLYADPENREALQEIIETATVCSYSTSRLLQLMAPPEDTKSWVIQNGVAKDIEWRLRNEESQVRSNGQSVLWRGSETHQKDLLSFAAQIVETANQNPDWKFDFMGYNPWFISDYIPYTQFLGSFTLRSYWEKIANCGAGLIIVPLFDDDFNRAKSNIAALEASWLTGANVICPDWDEWQIDGWLKYSGPEHFRQILSDFLGSGYNEELAEQSENAIRAKYTSTNKLSPQNERRLHILKDIKIIS